MKDSEQTSSSSTTEILRDMLDRADSGTLASESSDLGTYESELEHGKISRIVRRRTMQEPIVIDSSSSEEEYNAKILQGNAFQERFKSNANSREATAASNNKSKKHFRIDILVEQPSSSRHSAFTDKKISRLQRKAKRHEQQIRNLSRSFRVSKRRKQSHNDLESKPKQNKPHNPQSKIILKKLALGLAVAAVSYLLPDASALATEHLILPHFEHIQTVDRVILKEAVQYNNAAVALITGWVFLSLVEVKRLLS